MSESEMPPVPKKGGFGFWIVGALLLAGGAAWFLFARTGARPPDASRVVASASASGGAAESAPRLEHAPPPPPPPPPAAASVTAQAAANKPSAKAAASKPGACSSPCEGKSHAALEAALSGRGRQARSCYSTALRQDESLEGKLTVRVRVGADGRACSAQVSDDSVGSATLNACILNRFRGAAYPAPREGCVDVAVPMNFVAKP